MRYLIAIDPGNHMSIVHGTENYAPIVDIHDLSPKPATKGKAGKPATKKKPATLGVPGRLAEAEHIRYGKIWHELLMIRNNFSNCIDNNNDVVIIMESVTAFSQKSKRAGEVGNAMRGVIKAFAAYNNIKFVAIQPQDVKRFATGKGVAEKSEMIEVARSRYGYSGTDDNEADAIIIWHWAKEYCK